MSTPSTTVVVVTWRGRGHITACLDALARQRPHRTVVVDNASDDGTADLVAAHPSAPEHVRLPRNLGYAGGLAAVLPDVTSEYVAWLNDDAVPDDGWLAALEDALDATPDAAAATSSMVLADGSTQSVGVRLTADGHGVDLVLAGREVFGFCGGAALLRTAALARAGGVPAGFFCYYEDTDTAWRLRLGGHRVLSVGPARVRHRHGASTNPGSRPFHRWNERNRLLMLLRCAPLAVALREPARFAAITALLPLRRDRPDAENFRVGLRVRVLLEVLARLPATLVERARIGRRAAVPRRAVWREWAGR
ncbi:glycosyltransferase family 2 protein [Saccharothrix longispora]|uniref:GT2 family glycosyltransferase n=1 Tax=Saccharothrix longispora TaxID=33920 RepID=A0ABU1Q0Z8_9PSEU|nr:glycosyltransferase [Saccharothrix longispora]MDR6596572.1 GT2 family glycosyltransferase [Saccharothrix longispora]